MGEIISRRLLLVLGLLTVLVGAGAWLVFQPNRQAQVNNDAQSVVREYLAALASRDESAVTRVAPLGYIVKDDVRDRLARFGGLDATGAVVDVSDSIAHDVLTVRITATKGLSSNLSWTENLVRRDGKWFVLLGSAAGADPKNPADTNRPE